MAYGGPSSLADLPGYLADVRRGRPTPRAILAELERNYSSIGGRSPLPMLTQRQADALSRELNATARSARYAVHVGMRHWSPWIEETVGTMLDAGITRAVSLVLARAGGRPGHIFNLGHGVLQHTPPDSVRRLVEYVREQSAAGASASTRAPVRATA